MLAGGRDLPSSDASGLNDSNSSVLYNNHDAINYGFFQYSRTIVKNSNHQVACIQTALVMNVLAACAEIVVSLMDVIGVSDPIGGDTIAKQTVGRSK